MSKRKYPIITGQTYHVFNRGIGNQQIFPDKRAHRRFLEAVRFYEHQNLSIKLSTFLDFGCDKKAEFSKKIFQRDQRLVEIICFCLMPSHHHFLLKQLVDGGIAKFIGNIQNSYCRYLNIRLGRNGTLFQRPFKAIVVETQEQLLHVSRYIHLNPLSSFLVKNLEELLVYPWSSLSDYLGKTNIEFVKKTPVLDFFKNSKAYQKFIFDQADYQQTLEINKHLLFDYH